MKIDKYKAINNIGGLVLIAVAAFAHSGGFIEWCVIALCLWGAFRAMS